MILRPGLGLESDSGWHLVQAQADNLVREFDRAVRQLERWQRLGAPTLANRAKKLAQAPWLYSLLQLSRSRPIEVRGRTLWGARMHCYLPDYFHLLRLGILGDPQEARLGKFFARSLTADSVFFDVGASCGFYSLLAAHLIGGEKRVHAFEPTPFVYELLARNARSTPAIVSNECAVADEAGTATLHCDSTSAVANSIADGAPDDAGVTVRVVTLDDYCERHSVSPTHVKIDVEGVEDKVVRGAERTFRRWGPTIAMEMFLAGNAPHRASAEILLGWGFRANAVDERGELVATGIDPAALASYGSRKYLNLVFTKGS